MADQLGNLAPIFVGQMLHGYDDGHSLIASSVNLDETSSSLMLVMSDLAPSGRSPEDGWLTAYPLPEADRYVLARTWPAPEMSRPGCVWTHSLIFSYAALGSLRSFQNLRDLFRRPVRDFGAYRQPIAVPVSDEPFFLPASLYEPARLTLQSLYGGTRSIAQRLPTSEDAELLALAIWEQQWPRLRRRFSWTTVASHVSTSVPKFDLMLTSNSQWSAETHDKHKEASDVRQGWIVGALSDLRSGGRGEFRSDLRRFAMDVSAGRPAFALLASASLLSRSPTVRHTDVSAMVTLLSKRLKHGEGRLAKQAVLEAVLRSPEELANQTLGFAISLVPNLDDDELALGVARACWKSDRVLFWTELGKSPVGETAQNHFLKSRSKSQLINELRSPVADAQRILEQRPELVGDPDIWRSDQVTVKQIVAVARKSPKHLKAAVEGAFAAQNLQAALSLIEGRGTSLMFDAFKSWEIGEGKRKSERTGFTREWLVGAAVDHNAVRDYLEGDFRLRPSVVVLARLFGPTSFKGPRATEDLWFKSWETCAGVPTVLDQQYICCFFLARSCTVPSRSQSRMFGLSLDTVISNVEHQTNDPGARAILSEHFAAPGSFFAFLESNADRFIRGVARRVADKNVPVIDYVISGRTENLKRLLTDLSFSQAGRAVLKDALSQAEGRKVTKRRFAYLVRFAKA